jgi:hypothetical protein
MKEMVKRSRPRTPRRHARRPGRDCLPAGGGDLVAGGPRVAGSRAHDHHMGRGPKVEGFGPIFTAGLALLPCNALKGQEDLNGGSRLFRARADAS